MLFAILATATLFCVVERLWPAKALPKVRGWWMRIVWVNTVQLGIVLLAGVSWDRWMSGRSLFALRDHLGDGTSGLIAYLLSTAIFYVWHRIRHESVLFWRLCHQLHHSPRRIEVLASFYKHPVEILFNSWISSILVYPVLGCSVAAAGTYTLMAAVAEFFYHWNVRTPRWLGWVLQRPESHRIHHQYRHHSQNYADLPIWDWMFGTLNNAVRSPARCGFRPKLEARFGDMLRFQDVHAIERTALPGELPVTCFGCRKRWACKLDRSRALPGEDPS